jgi:hypothetical protein
VNPAAQVDRPPVRVDEFGVEPVGDGVCVVDGRRQRYRLQIGVAPAQLRQGNLQGWAAPGVVDEVDLVGDDAGQVVDPVGAVSQQGVHLLAGGDDDVAVTEPALVALEVARRHGGLDARVLEALELGVFLARERPQRDDVKRRAAVVHRREHRHRGDERLTAGSGYRRHQRLALGDASLDGLALWGVQFLDAVALDPGGGVGGQPRNVTRSHHPYLTPHRV